MIRTFYPGGHWLYFKFYTGEQIGNMILLNEISPLARKLISDKIITSWHFVRYYDSEFHLRVRFHLNENSNYGEVVLMVKDVLSTKLDGLHIWDVQIATYERELERYGEEYIEKVEDIFFKQSEVVVRLLQQNDEPLERFLVGLKCVYDNLRFVIQDNKAQLDFVKRMKEYFFKEFKLDKAERKGISLEYSAIQKDLKNKLFASEDENEIETSSIWLTNDMMKGTIIDNSVDFKLLSDLIHMFVNKMFTKKQRESEMLIYSCLVNLIAYKINN